MTNKYFINTKDLERDVKIKNAEKIPPAKILNSRGVPTELQPVAAIPHPGVKLTYGIKETLEAVKLIAAISNSIYKVALGGWVIGWVGIVWAVVPIVPNLIKGIKGLGEVANEIEDMSEEEKQIIIEEVKKDLIFEDDVESIVGIALDVLYKLKTIAGVFK